MAKKIEVDIDYLKTMSVLSDIPQIEIARQFNYSQSTISRVKEKLGFTMKKKNVQE